MKTCANSLLAVLVILMLVVACGKQETLSPKEHDDAIASEVKQEQETLSPKEHDQVIIGEVNQAVINHLIDLDEIPESVEDLASKGYLEQVPELKFWKSITIHEDGALLLEKRE